jgi:rSAM/selenodomain-associated transferase 2
MKAPLAPALSIILPVLNEAALIKARLLALAPLRAAGAQVIVADGGSADDTGATAAPHCDAVIAAPRGRASQMNAGALQARGEVLLFLHADTRLPEGAMALVLDGLAQTGAAWGRFDVRIEGRSRLLPLIAALMNLRSRLTGIATGDQAFFIRRDAFEALGGFPDIALMEDVAMSGALKAISPPLCLRAKVVTSGRRWDQNGALRTILLMWRLRLAYWRGANPDDLALRYGYKPKGANAQKDRT